MFSSFFITVNNRKLNDIHWPCLSLVIFCPNSPQPLLSPYSFIFYLHFSQWFVNCQFFAVSPSTKLYYWQIFVRRGAIFFIFSISYNISLSPFPFLSSKFLLDCQIFGKRGLIVYFFFTLIVLIVSHPLCADISRSECQSFSLLLSYSFSLFNSLVAKDWQVQLIFIPSLYAYIRYSVRLVYRLFFALFLFAFF